MLFYTPVKLRYVLRKYTERQSMLTVYSMKGGGYLSVPNQRKVTICYDPNTAKGGHYVKLYHRVMDKAMKDFAQHSSYSTLYLYLYLIRNKNGYTFELSRSDVMAHTGLSKDTYSKSFNDLVKLGYLVQLGGSARYNFYAESQKLPANEVGNSCRQNAVAGDVVDGKATHGCRENATTVAAKTIHPCRQNATRNSTNNIYTLQTMFLGGKSIHAEEVTPTGHDSGYMSRENESNNTETIDDDDTLLF